jgi:hypothetical protein
MLSRHVEQWKDGLRVTSRRGVFKNLQYNPCGYTIKRKQPLKQTGCLLVDRHSLRANLGKRRAIFPDAVDLGPQEEEPNSNFALVISKGKLKLNNYSKPHKAYQKNLSFLHGGKRSCKQLKYVARFICDYGITVRLYRKLSLAALLVTAGKANAALRLYRSVANRCGQLRHRTEHAFDVREPSLSDSSSCSDW